MRILSLLIISVFMIFMTQKTDSPHGTGFKVSCKTCHSAKGWYLDKTIYSFNHDKTSMKLTGQHTRIDCRQCHVSLVFAEAKNNCSDCHKDVHQGTTGLDCSRCHTSESWLVNNIKQIHDVSRFPLLGAHRTADCIQCHKSENPVRFDVPGIECIDCHSADYTSAKNPDHVASGISKECSTCHKVNAFQWGGSGYNHDFFPLLQGHSAVNCNQCHTSGVFTGLSKECVTCHQADYNGAKNPDHAQAKFTTVCTSCHTLAPGWKPANFDHSKFPLTLGHSVPVCTDCHTGGNYTSTPTDCYACHVSDFNSAKNPDHVASGFAKTCLTCHTTNPGWKPATFNHSKFPLTLGHAGVNCIDCHKGGNYTTTPTDCYACHKADYDKTTNPGHAKLSFATTCTQCHTTNPGWKPATYTQHDTQSFRIYSGKHKGTWATCTECHTNPAAYASYTCISCHEHNQTDMDSEHRGQSGYSYNSTACFTCHPKV
jgi:hypothetical protein